MPDVPGVINWPATADSAATLLQVRDLTSTVLTADITDLTTTLPVASTTDWPDTGVVTIEGEHVTYTAKTGTTLTVGTRGAFQADGGSVPTSHDLGASVTMRVIAASHRVLVDAILAVQGKQGAGADTPAAGEFFKGTGAGTSGWSALAGSEVNTALGYTAADAATLSSHTAAANPHSGSQPLDAELTAIAGLTSAADRVPYFTGSESAALATFTAAGRALVDDADNTAQRTTLGLGSIATQGANSVAITGGAITGITDLAIADGGTGASDAAGARTNLGLAIGTDVQAQDAELQALAGLTSAADRVPYFTGSGVAALATFTAAGRALVDDADNAAQRTTLGLGSVDNTSDAAKPISTLTQAALDAKQPLDLDLTTIAGLTATTDNLIQSVSGAWASRTPTQVKTALALNNVNNTSDANKPVSTAQATAIAGAAAPTGAITMWALSTAPTGWALCNGATVLRSSALGTLLVADGMPYGSGNGSTTVNLPDLQGRFPIGKSAATTAWDTLGETGGAATHTLSLTEIPAHTHTFDVTTVTSGAGPNVPSYRNGGTMNTGSAGSDGAHNNMPPYLTVQFIIKL